MRSVAYAPEGKYVGDMWFFTGPDRVHHMFYLEMGHDIPADQRGDNSVVAHATSTNYEHWQRTGTVLHPGEPGSWDDIAPWTGSVIQSGDTGDYHQFYTGRGWKDPFAQKVGQAISTNLTEWRKTSVEQPVLEAVSPYSTYTGKDRGFPAWRDPFLLHNEHSKQYEMLITARLGDTAFNGCIARAVSPDLHDWKVQAPLIAPGAYDEMEVPQVVYHQDGAYVFFSTWAKGYNPGWKEVAGGAWSGLHAYYADGTDFSQPFRPVNGNGVVDANGDEIYAVRLLERIGDSNDYLATGWLNKHPRTSQYMGVLSTPFIVTLDNGQAGARLL